MVRFIYTSKNQKILIAQKNIPYRPKVSSAGSSSQLLKKPKRPF